MADLRTALQLASEANVAKTNTSRDRIFASWIEFCAAAGCSPSLRDIRNQDDKISYLLVFGYRYRTHGRNSGKKPVRAGTVEDALLAVGKGITHLGEPDPRKASPGSAQNHPLLAAFLKRLRDTDDPAARAYPANVTILRALYQVLDTAHPTEGQLNKSIIDLTVAAFYWLLRPAEYLFVSDEPESRSQAFRLRDVAFVIDGQVHHAPSAPLNDLNDVNRITAATLTFNDQKNAVRGEQIGHRATNDPDLCPCKALGRIVLHLRQHNAPPDTPLYTVYANNTTSAIRPAFITNGIRHAAKHLQPTTGIDPYLLSARSLRPGGATALLCAGVASDAIQLMGRWKSDAMLRYLRVQAITQMHAFSQCMLDHGSYTFTQHVYVTVNPDPIPEQPLASFVALLDAANDDS